MTLHPQAKARVDAVAALDLPPAETLPVEVVRAGYDRSPRTPGPAVGTVRDLDADGVPVRLYHPSPDPTGGRPAPLVVFAHGGGWTIGSLDSHDAVCRHLCNDVGAAVVAVDYRLAPEHPYPAAADDCWTALRWAVDNAASFGTDGGRVAVAGDSAGGNLATVLALRARAAGGPPIAAQLLVYPAVDGTCSLPSHAENGEGLILTAGVTRWFWSNYAGPDEAARSHPELSPLHHPDLSGLPPALVVTAGHDPLRDEGRAYVDRLEAAGVDARLVERAGAIHTFFEDIDAFEDGRAAMDEAASFLRRHLAVHT